MACRRMFSRDVIETDNFMDMPLTSQALYFHLGLQADDDGFVAAPKKILKETGCAEDDLRVLVSKKFVIPFDSGVLVITNWKENNYLRSDRYRPTRFQDEFQQLTVDNGIYRLKDDGIPVGIPVVDQRLTQDSKGKVRKEKVKDNIDYAGIISLFNNICKGFPRVQKLSENRKKAIRARFSDGYTQDDFETVFTMAEKSDFLRGNNSSGWIANFDWFLKPENFVKVFEGTYNDRKEQAKAQPQKPAGDYYNKYLNKGESA